MNMSEDCQTGICPLLIHPVSEFSDGGFPRAGHDIPTEVGPDLPDEVPPLKNSIHAPEHPIDWEIKTGRMGTPPCRLDLLEEGQLI
jgi:hypothetical protein